MFLNQMNSTELALVILVSMGAAVDIFQFSWIVAKAYKKMRQRIYDHVRKQILIDQHLNNIKQNKQEETGNLFPGLEADNEQK